MAVTYVDVNIALVIANIARRMGQMDKKCIITSIKTDGKFIFTHSGVGDAYEIDAKHQNVRELINGRPYETVFSAQIEKNLFGENHG